MLATLNSKVRRASALAPLIVHVLLASSTGTSAQSIRTLLVTGDTVASAPGTLSNIDDISVTDDGSWFARVQLTTGTDLIEAAVLNGTAILLQGDALVNPAGLSVVRFDEVDLSADGTLWWNIYSDATTQTDEVMSLNRVQFCVGRLETVRLAISRETDVEHIQNLERRHGSAT